MQERIDALVAELEGMALESDTSEVLAATQASYTV